jgi:hypothetical protein
MELFWLRLDTAGPLSPLRERGETSNRQRFGNLSLAPQGPPLLPAGGGEAGRRGPG